MDFINIYEEIKKCECVNTMKPKIKDYKKGEELTIGFPILKEYLNLRNSMQGGFITAAFDNAFGMLFFIENRGDTFVTIDISTSYQRPIFFNDELIITVKIKQKGNNIVHMTGEAHNTKGKLIATSYTNIMRIKE